MNRRTSACSNAYSRGLSLIELMVSIAIGLILMIAVMSAYIGSAGAGRVAEAQGRMNEDAQAALTILSQQLRMAGNNPKQVNYEDAVARNPVYGAATYIVRGCDGTFSNVTTAANIPALTCAAGGTTADSIAISYEADVYNTVPTSGGLPTDCLGQALPIISNTLNVWDGTAAVPTAVTYSVADNRFYVATSTQNTSPTLYCKGSGNANAQPLVENIENLQLTYGTAPSTGATMSVAGYLDAATILTDTGLAALASDPARWAKVMTVRICVVARSEQQVVANAASAQYVSCDGNLITPPDQRLRRAYSTTVVLRNRVAS